MTNAEAWFNKSLCPRKPEGSLGQTAQDVHLDSHTAPELCVVFGAVCGLCSQRQLIIQWPLVPVINKSVIMHTGIRCLDKFVCAEYVYLFVDHFRLIIIILD